MDSYQIPDETKIYYSKNVILFSLIVLAGLIWSGIYCFFAANILGGIILIAIGLLPIYNVYKQYKNREPQIVINDRGMQTSATKFYTWEEIGNEIVVYEDKDETKCYYLEYDCPNGREEFLLSDLDVNYNELIQALTVYRERSGKEYKYKL
jgi:hypothetical protein